MSLEFLFEQPINPEFFVCQPCWESYQLGQQETIGMLVNGKEVFKEPHISSTQIRRHEIAWYACSKDQPKLMQQYKVQL